MFRKLAIQILVVALVFNLFPLIQLNAQVADPGTCIHTTVSDGAVFEDKIHLDQAACAAKGDGWSWVPAGSPNALPADKQSSTGANGGGVGNVNVDGKNVTDGSSCGYLSFVCQLTEWLLFVPGLISLGVMKVASFIAYLAGTILNWVVQYTVVHMTDRIKQQDIINAWRVIRDVGNMGFIFILLYAAIQTIIGEGSKTRGVIVNIVIAALLVNFSLFFTEAAIDASNVVAMTFYDKIAPGALGTPSNPDASWLSAGLSSSLMQQMKMGELYNIAHQDPSHLGDRLLIVGIMGTIFCLVIAFAFFAVSVLFVLRFIVLIFLLALSPIAFLAMVLPGTKSYRDKWLNALVGQLTFPPVFFLLMWVVLVLIKGLLVQTNAGYTDTAAAPSFDSVGLMINFFIIIGFLMAAIIISKEASDKTGNGVNKITGWAMGAAGGASFGLFSRAGRYSVGAAAEKFKSSDAYKRLERNAPNSMTSRLALSAVNTTRRASFDPRSVLGAAGINAGTPSKGGFEADKKAYREFMEKPGTEAYKQRQERARSADNKLKIVDGTKARASATEIAEMQKVVKEMSAKEIVALDKNTLATKEVAEALTTKHLKAIEDDKEKFTENDKREIFEKHFADIAEATEALATGVSPSGTPLTQAQEQTYRNRIKNISEKEMEYIPSSIFDANKLDASHTGPEAERSRAFLKNLSQTQADKLVQGDIPNSQKQSVKDARVRPFNESFANANAGAIPWTGTGSAVEQMEKMGEPALAKLEANYNPTNPATHGVPNLNNPNILEIYVPSVLNKLAAQPEFNPAKRNAVRQAIMDSVAADPALSSALTSLSTAATPAARQAILSSLPNDRAKRLVTSAEWLNSPNGNQIF